MELEEVDMEETIESREAREAGRRRKGQNKKNRKRLLSPGRLGKPAGGGRGRTRRTGRDLARREQQRRLLARRRRAGSPRSKRLLGNHRVDETTRAQGPDRAGPPPTTLA